MHIVKPAPEPRQLDRAKWHKPLVSIIVTHHNYSAHLEDCLCSILDQSYDNWECVVVDDASDDTHRTIAELLVETLREPRIRFLALEDNVGQIPAFFAGLDATKGEFVCPLDPDDRYAQGFLAEMVAVHINDVLYAPLASCDEMLLAGDAVVTGCYTGHKRRIMEDEHNLYSVPDDLSGLILHFPSTERGWHWSSTSGMMLRRAALNLMRPNKTLAYKRALDAYLGHGAHMLGGALFFTKPLVYRGVHDANSWLANGIYAMRQSKRSPTADPRAPECIVDVREAIIANGVGDDIAKPMKRNLPQRLRRSLAKRWQRWMGAA